MTTTNLERRYQKALGLEVRAKTEEDSAPVIRGYGIVYGKYSVDLGGFVEEVDPGALTKTLKESSNVYASFNHDPNYVLARVKAGTLRLTPDDNGLLYEIDPDLENPFHQHVLSSVRRGDVNGSSFMFRVLDDEWRELEDGRLCRTITQLALYELGPVVSPAYPDTDSTASRMAFRSLAKAKGMDVEEVVRCAREGHLLDVVRETPADLGTVTGEGTTEPGDHSESRLRAARAKLWLMED